MSRPIVVIGGGIVGTTIAYELQKAGAPTILVERDLEPQGASAFSFASLTAFDEPQRDAYLLKTHGMIAWRELAKVSATTSGRISPASSGGPSRRRRADISHL